MLEILFRSCMVHVVRKTVINFKNVIDLKKKLVHILKAPIWTELQRPTASYFLSCRVKKVFVWKDFLGVRTRHEKPWALKQVG